jgi:hypothetical protein
VLVEAWMCRSISSLNFRRLSESESSGWTGLYRVAEWTLGDFRAYPGLALACDRLLSVLVARRLPVATELVFPGTRLGLGSRELDLDSYLGLYPGILTSSTAIISGEFARSIAIFPKQSLCRQLAPAASSS